MLFWFYSLSATSNCASSTYRNRYIRDGNDIAYDESPRLGKTWEVFHCQKSYSATAGSGSFTVPVATTSVPPRAAFCSRTSIDRMPSMF